MYLYDYLKKSICFALMCVRFDLKLRQQTVAEQCGLRISDLDDMELGLRPLSYAKYERLLRFYKKRSNITLEDKEDESGL